MVDTHDAQLEGKMSSASSSQESLDIPQPEPPKTSYAFLVHSANTLTNNLPPDVDNKPLARQKRRRTSPEDQAILEQEYAKNPKPDKAARMDIVRRVALGEKEVQIWFQNRRQSSRRKSRPLLPHEVAQFQASRSQPEEFLPSASPSQESSVPQEQQQQVTDPTSHAPTAGTEPSTQHPTVHVAESKAVERVEDAPPSQVIPSSQDSNTGRPSYLADRRSTAPRPSQDEADFENVASSQISITADPPARRELRKSSSVVRLSMTSDGVARIVTDADSSPSPPRIRPSDAPSSSAPAAYQDDQSLTMAESERPNTLRRKPSGRSRDSRAWEFWCDRDARSQLEEKADQEASGSAADAIGLIRSNSGRNILGSLIGKRDSPFRESTSAKRTKVSRTPLLQRSQSVQNKPIARTSFGSKPSAGSPRKFKKAASGLGIRMTGPDSDKENWSPERIIPASERSIRTIESDDDLDESQAAVSAPRGSLKTPRNHSWRDDDLNSSAHHTGRKRESKSNSVSEEEELDCVQGLLSLSQGNWR